MRKTRKSHGFTLVELVMAISITSLIGLAVAGASTALSSAHAHSQSQYDSTQTARVAMRQIQYSLQRARLVTAVGSNGNALAYWVGDENNDGTISLLELRVLRYNPDSRNITEYSVQYPASWAEWLVDSWNWDVTLAEAMSMALMEWWVAGWSYCSGRTLADDVQAFKASLDQRTPLGTLARVEFTVGDGDQATTLRSAAALRADMTHYVMTDGTGYVLNLPEGN